MICASFANVATQPCKHTLQEKTRDTMSTWTPSAMQSPRARWATAMRETRGATRVSALRNINEHSLRVSECGRDHQQRRIVYLPPSPHVYFIIRKHKPRTRNRRTDDARRERETDGREGETERGTTARGLSQTAPVARTESYHRTVVSRYQSLMTEFIRLMISLSVYPALYPDPPLRIPS